LIVDCLCFVFSENKYDDDDDDDEYDDDDESRNFSLWNSD